MRLTRPRFTVRRLMLTVAVVGVVFRVMIERQSRFRKLASHHQAEMVKLARQSPYVTFSNFGEAINCRLDWHYTMSLKYEEAASHPWLPVRPDSPEPK